MSDKYTRIALAFELILSNEPKNKPQKMAMRISQKFNLLDSRLRQLNSGT